MAVAWERYRYLQLSPQQRAAVPPPRPLKILIMGGSLLVGTNCGKTKSELGFQFAMPKRECNWSNRLGEFLNPYFGNSFFCLDMVQVTKVAMGGTNTATRNVIWQYDLIPEEARNPDIVFNAYSTNDMHILTILEAQSANTTLRDKVFEMTQDFARQVLYTLCESKPPPLLLHVNDYLGNEQRKIWDERGQSLSAKSLALCSTPSPPPRHPQPPSWPLTMWSARP
jgi:lysophospholipase L1-like esterase